MRCPFEVLVEVEETNEWSECFSIFVLQKRLGRFAAKEPKAGVVCSTCSLLDEPRYNHRIRWQGGVLAEMSSERLQAFFRERRK